MKTERTVVITGAAGGIGSALVQRFLTNGDTVVATDTSEDALEAIRRDNDAGSQLITGAADIAQEDHCQQLGQLARDQTGRVDVLINCAGFFPFKPFEEMSVAEWQQVIDVNLTGPFLVTRAMLPLRDVRPQRGQLRLPHRLK